MLMRPSIYKNGRYISRTERLQNKKQIKIALLIGLCLVVIVIVFDIKVYL